MNEHWDAASVTLDIPRDPKVVAERAQRALLALMVGGVLTTLGWVLLAAIGAPDLVQLLAVGLVGAGSLLAAGATGRDGLRALLRPRMRVAIRPHEIAIDDRRFDIRTLWRARFRANRIVLGLRDGNDWASDPLLVDDPERLVALLCAVMPSLQDFQDEGEAEHHVRRQLASLRERERG